MAEIKLVYQQIKEYIAEEIEKTEPGAALPSEVSYAARFSVSRPTVRKAVDELITDGLIRRVPGKGLFVSSSESARPFLPILILIHFNVEDGFFNNAVIGIIDACNQYEIGYKILNYADSETRLEEVRSIDWNSYAGVILSAYENAPDQEVLDILERSGRPFVLIDNPITGRECISVVCDDFRGGYLAAKHLAAQGHRKILYISLQGEYTTVRLREAGFRRALEEEGITLAERDILRIGKDEDVVPLVETRPADYTAIGSYSDIPALLALHTLERMGLRVPDNISLIGYGNFAASTLVSVPLTTIAMPTYDMGRRAGETLAEIIKGQKVQQKQVLEVQLLQRASVGSL